MAGKLKTSAALFTGLFSAVGSAFVTCGTVCMGGACCIPPVLSLLGLSSYAASYVAFLDPVMPYLICFTIASLGYAFYKTYEKKKNDSCCSDNSDSKACCSSKVKETNTMKSKIILWIITLTCLTIYAYPVLLSAEEYEAEIITEEKMSVMDTIKSKKSIAKDTTRFKKTSCCVSTSSCSETCK